MLDRDGSVTLRVLQTRPAARQSSAAKPFTLSVSIDGALPKAAGVSGKPVTEGAAKAAAKAAGAGCQGSGTLTGGTANMSGSLAGDAVCTYTVSAKKGQSFSLLLDAPAGVEVMVRAPGAATAMPLVPDQPEAMTVTGAHGVIIGRTRNDARKGGSRDFSAVLNVE